MLGDLQKNNLSKLAQRYSFQHLRPSPQVYEITIPENELFIVSGSDRRRRIFYKVGYEDKQIDAVQELKRKLKEKEFVHPFTDQVLLKHIYGAKWSISKAAERIQKLLALQTDERITRFDEKTIQGLNSGRFYCYGQDKGMRPNVVVRVDKIDFKQSMQNNFNAFYYLMLVVFGYKMVPYHAEKYNLIMDFNNISLTDIPFVILYEALDLIGLFYCCSSEKAYIFNSEGVSNIWRVISFFLSQSQRKRAIFINKGEEKKMLQYFDQYELQRRYGGKLANLNTFWPPKNTSESFDVQLNEQKHQQSFYSVENNQSYFDIATVKSIGCPIPSCQCIIY